MFQDIVDWLKSWLQKEESVIQDADQIIADGEKVVKDGEQVIADVEKGDITDAVKNAEQAVQDGKTVETDGQKAADDQSKVEALGGHAGPRDRLGKSHNHPQDRYYGHGNPKNDKVK